MTNDGNSAYRHVVCQVESALVLIVDAGATVQRSTEQQGAAVVVGVGAQRGVYQGAFDLPAVVPLVELPLHDLLASPRLRHQSHRVHLALLAASSYFRLQLGQPACALQPTL